MGKKKPIISPFGQWAYPGEVTIIPSSDITMKGVNYPVLGIDDLGNQQMMMPGQDYTFPGNYVTEIPQMGKGGLRQWFAEEWKDVKTGKPCGRSGKDKDGRPYPACRPSKRVNETTPKTTSEMSSAEKAKFKREKTSGKRIDYNHKRREFGGESWLDQYQDGSEVPSDIERMSPVNINIKRKKVSDNPTYQYDNQGNLLYAPDLNINPYALDNSTKDNFWVNPKLPINNLNPTVEELRQVAAAYYPIDNKLISDSKINLQPSNYQQSLEKEYVLPQAVGKSFGNLPIVKDDGYSPNRRWVSNLRAKDTGSRYSKDYAYVLKTNPNNLVDYSNKKNIEDDLSLNNKIFYDYLAKNNYLPDTVERLTAKLPDQIWNRAEQMRIEMRNNPEIMSWANLHNVDLGYKEPGKRDDFFAPKIPESMYANRLVKAGLPTNRPDFDYSPQETYVIQDPSKFDLAGYFPMGSIVNDATQKVLDKEIPGKLKREFVIGTDVFERESYIKDEIAKRMGLDPSAFNNGEYLIHYNQSPITEYTPGKKYGGWLSKYQDGGWFSNFIVANPQLATNLFAGANVVKKSAEKIGDASKQQMFDRYRPIDYPDPIGAITGIGKDIPLRDLQGDYHVSEEAWRLALGLPTKSKYITPSKYKPSKANDPNAQYYSLNNVYDPQKLIDAYIQKSKGKPGQTIQMDSLFPYVVNQDILATDTDIQFDQTDPLQKFSLSQGEDEKGRYISIYDKYDFNVPLMDNVVYGSNRKPYEFYDRFYYKKDATGKPVYVKQRKDGGQTSWLNKYK